MTMVPMHSNVQTKAVLSDGFAVMVDGRVMAFLCAGDEETTRKYAEMILPPRTWYEVVEAKGWISYGDPHGWSRRRSSGVRLFSAKKPRARKPRRKR